MRWRMSAALVRRDGRENFVSVFVAGEIRPETITFLGRVYKTTPRERTAGGWPVYKET